jgi:hypothetical protein
MVLGSLFGSPFWVRRGMFYVRPSSHTSQDLQHPPGLARDSRDISTARRMLSYRRMTRGVKRFTDLRAWQASDVFKKAVYRLCENKPIAADFARFCVIARSSLMESQSHLLDVVDKRYITEEARLTINQLAETALEEVTGSMEYLQSPEALRNARRARERHIASRPQRRSENSERRTQEPNRESEHEQRTEKPEALTAVTLQAP